MVLGMVFEVGSRDGYRRWIKDRFWDADVCPRSRSRAGSMVLIGLVLGLDLGQVLGVVLCLVLDQSGPSEYGKVSLNNIVNNSHLSSE